uniref:Uncharacterized protein n=1 Tax=Physcomitrium patens TaxID=3218 RepID=A0A2K1IIS6_PHYPA|nr:hypothetical protein PHYPA_027875 [Physcomitrium patens]
MTLNCKLRLSVGSRCGSLFVRDPVLSIGIRGVMMRNAKTVIPDRITMWMQAKVI